MFSDRMKVYFLLSNVILSYVVTDMFFHVSHARTRARAHTQYKITVSRMLPQTVKLVISISGQ
jgi:hypothetical protein